MSPWLQFLGTLFFSSIFMFIGRAWFKAEAEKEGKYSLSADLKDFMTPRWKYGRGTYSEGVKHYLQPSLIFLAGPFLIMIHLLKYFNLI